VAETGVLPEVPAGVVPVAEVLAVVRRVAVGEAQRLPATGAEQHSLLEARQVEGQPRGEEQTGDGERHRSRQAVEDFRQCRLAGRNRSAQVANDGTAQEQPVLLDERTIETKLRPQSCERLLGRVIAKHVLSRVARNSPHQEEGNGDDPKDRHRELNQAAPEISEHLIIP